MPNAPLNPDAEVSKDQTVFAYEAAERDYPQHGSIMLKLHHSNFQSSLWQVSKRTAESLRDQLNDLLAVAQPEVNSVEELDALPAGSVITTFAHGRCTIVVMKVADNQWASTGQRSVWTTEDVHAGLKGQAATVLHLPEVDDA